MDYTADASNLTTRLWKNMRDQARIILAMALRDMRTRFGRTYLSYLLALAWPLGHAGMIALIFMGISKFVPFGGSPTIFIATGALPYVLCLYPARMLTLTIIQNKPLLSFPIVKTMDMLLARILVEAVAAVIVTLVFIVTLVALDVDIMPLDVPQALTAILATIYLGIGIGILNVIVMTLFKFWLIAFVLMMSAAYATAGISSFPLALTATSKYYLSFNPVLQVVIWMRTAYYGDYSDMAFSKTYVLSFATISLFVGLVGERLLRGRVMTASI